MKKSIITVAAVFMIVAIAQTVMAETWPPSLPALSVKMQSGSKVCAIFAMSGGGITISCATKDSTTAGVYTNVVTSKCPLSGTKQVCATPTGTKSVNRADSYASKCNQVCGPVSPAFVSF